MDYGGNFTQAGIQRARMIDEATGREQKFIEQYIAWFQEKVWGEE